MKARFFCDSCGASVGARADRCPACGKTFAAVRCPQCGFEGTPSEFSRGCPTCGYMAREDAAARRVRARSPRREVRLSPAMARVAAATLLLLLAVFFVIILLQ